MARDIFVRDPAGTIWVEIRKVLFTFGFTGFGPPGSPPRTALFLLPPLVRSVGVARSHSDDARDRADHVRGLAHHRHDHRRAVDVLSQEHRAVSTLPVSSVQSTCWTAADTLPGYIMRQGRSVDVEPRDLRTKRIRFGRSCLDFAATGVVDEVLVINNDAAAARQGSLTAPARLSRPSGRYLPPSYRRAWCGLHARRPHREARRGGPRFP